MTRRPGVPSARRHASSAKSSRGKTQAAQLGEPAPVAPHERDESSDRAGRDLDHDRRGHLAHDDIRSGRKDTDRGELTDETYRRLKGER